MYKIEISIVETDWDGIWFLNEWNDNWFTKKS